MSDKARLIVVGVGLLLALTAGVRGFQSRLNAVWLGQIGEDRVGPSAKEAPSGVQDLVFELRGLPPGRGIQSVRLTGKGGDEWNFNGRQGSWAAALEPGKGGTARIFVEPSRREEGREFQFEVIFAGGQKVELYARGGKADPNRRTQAAAMGAVWIGQDGSDRTGPTAAVGPDGWRDLRIGLEKLSPGIGVAEVNIRDGKGRAWAAGKNPAGVANAEFIPDPDDKSKGDLYFDPGGPVAANDPIAIQVVYENGKKDRADVKCPTAVAPLRTEVTPLPKVEPLALEARWKVSRAGGGVRAEVLLAGVGKREPESVVVTDSWRRMWVWKKDGGVKVAAMDWAGALEWEEGTNRLQFEATEIVEGTRFSVRFADQEGSQAIGEIVAPALPVVDSAGKLAAEATNEEQLRRFAREWGRRVAIRGTIRLREPLEVGPDTSLEGRDGAVLEFEQPQGGAPWGEAIRLGGGWSRLTGFSVRFAGPVEWDRQVAFGPAVIGRDAAAKGITRVELLGLDIEPPPGKSDWEEAPQTARFMGSTSGKIEGCKIQGGMITVIGGPWRIVGNSFRGTRAGTFAYATITAHHSRGLVVAENSAIQEVAGGKVWRFLVLPRSAVDTVVERNKIAGIGPRDDDPRPHPNAPEIVLTEGYRTAYEGKVGVAERGGRLLVIHKPQGDAVLPGQVVAVVSGPGAGGWAKVDQVITPTVLWLDRAVDAGRGDVAIGEGFVGQSYEGNTIDCGGSKRALPFVLAGSHFGTKVARNRMIGGQQAIRLTAFPTEQPVHWGWSFCPTFDAIVEGNRAEDPAEGSFLGVERTASSKSTAGRTYFTASLADNTVAWSRPGGRVAWTIGDAKIGEPAEARIDMRGSTVEATADEVLGPTLRIECGTVNGQPYRGAAFELNRGPAKAGAG